jgi:beta-glucosidase
VTWAEQELKGFKRVPVAAGASETVEIVVKASDCSIVNADGDRVVEPGAFEIRVGKASNDIRQKLGFTIA